MKCNRLETKSFQRNTNNGNGKCRAHSLDCTQHQLRVINFHSTTATAAILVGHKTPNAKQTSIYNMMRHPWRSYINQMALLEG